MKLGDLMLEREFFVILRKKETFPREMVRQQFFN